MMAGPSSTLDPLDAAGPAIRILERQGTSEEHARAVGAVAAAVERSLRLLLRADADAPDDVREAALSPDALPADRVIERLRADDRISLELAGAIHELLRASDRAARGEVRPRDIESARRAAGRLRQDVTALEAVSPGSAAARLEEAHGRERILHAVPPAGARPRSRLLVAALALLLVVAGGITLLIRSRADGTDEAVAAFRAERLDAAAAAFREIVEDDPDDVTARLYLARIQRRQGRYAEAAETLRAAAREAPDDPDVRRELGYLFLDLERPRAAVGQFDTALELEPDEPRSWIGLIRSLRASGDPRSDSVLRRAPSEVRAVLTKPG